MRLLSQETAQAGGAAGRSSSTLVPIESDKYHRPSMNRQTAARARARRTESARAQAPGRIPPLRLVLALIALLACSVFLPAVRANSRLAWSVIGASGSLLLFVFLLSRRVAETGRSLRYEFVGRQVHYVQLAMQASLYAYWGWYWSAVYRQIPLIIVQVFFVYALDMLVCWSRRDKWILGFGTFPIVLSANLFIWFKPDWYFLQFLMLATGVLCKEFITWEREGRRAHIFNPSAIALFIFSAGLIATGSTEITWAREISVSFDRPPFIFLEVFLLGIVVQALFSVTLVTLSAAAVLYALNLAYTASTGLYWFVDTGMPAAVFLGVILLVTDPATSPRKNFGKILFGVMYGAGVFVLFGVLDRYELTFYDKLLVVPLLNLTVRALDRASDAVAARLPLSAWSPRRVNFVAIGVWSSLFAVMLATGFMGGRHPGTDPRFWRTTCGEGHPTACRTWVGLMRSACTYDTGPACMELGSALTDGVLLPRDPVEAGKAFAHACEIPLPDGCAGLRRVVEQTSGGSFQSACEKGDGESCFLLGSLYMAGFGVPKDAERAFALFQRSCSVGWRRGCFGLAESYRDGNGATIDNARAIESFDKACRAGLVPGCFSASSMYQGLHDNAAAQARLRQGCELSIGYAQSAEALISEGSPARAPAVPAVCSSF